MRLAPPRECDYEQLEATIFTESTSSFCVMLLALLELDDVEVEPDVPVALELGLACLPVTVIL